MCKTCFLEGEGGGPFTALIVVRAVCHIPKWVIGFYNQQRVYYVYFRVVEPLFVRSLSSLLFEFQILLWCCFRASSICLNDDIHFNNLQFYRKLYVLCIICMLSAWKKILIDLGIKLRRKCILDFFFFFCYRSCYSLETASKLNIIKLLNIWTVLK